MTILMKRLGKLLISESTGINIPMYSVGLDQAENLGFHIPVLIHPTAYISPSAVIEAGTVVEPKAIVNANTVVQKGCIALYLWEQSLTMM